MTGFTTLVNYGTMAESRIEEREVYHALLRADAMEPSKALFERFFVEPASESAESSSTMRTAASFSCNGNRLSSLPDLEKFDALNSNTTQDSSTTPNDDQEEVLTTTTKSTSSSITANTLTFLASSAIIFTTNATCILLTFAIISGADDAVALKVWLPYSLSFSAGMCLVFAGMVLALYVDGQTCRQAMRGAFCALMKFVVAIGGIVIVPLYVFWFVDLVRYRMWN